jgi:HPt (histidine-containing phosphotransfer) domain-containing protein
MDVQMPGVDGIQATQAIRNLGSYKAGIPIIAVTANALVGHREFYLQSGMNDYLSKPISRDRLLAILARWLGEKAGGIPADTQAEPVAPVPDIVDRAYLDELRSNLGDTTYRDLIGSYVDAMVTGLANLENFVAAGDLPKLLYELHSLKGMSANYGAWGIHTLFARLEESGKAADEAATGALMQSARRVWDDTRSTMERTMVKA